ncbi:glycosyltransferase [Spongiimicrobium sp. 2-473A-2-J]|uniref:glycosyltransferase n=1 Tax=Eudoraea algarum TaxID=3417568 RepID=UPI003D35F3D2
MKKRPSIKSSLCIVVPCYNEEKHFQRARYVDFLDHHPEVLLCFVNDGSTDRIKDVLEGLHIQFPQQVDVVSYEKNMGKAEAVRRGFIRCYICHNYTHIAYLDADLSTSLWECAGLTAYFEGHISFVFGSRIMKMGSTIIRSPYRFVIGRILASIIGLSLQLKVYDTQCGCKLFTRELSKTIFESTFTSRWLFDVEIFHRLIHFYGRERAVHKMVEVPLQQWIDYGNSKVRPSYFLQLWKDLYKIRKRYKEPLETDLSVPAPITTYVQESIT